MPPPPEFVRVVVDRPVDREFTYRVPPHLAGRVAAGARLRVPFHGSLAAAFCVGFEEAPPEGVPLQDVRDVSACPPLPSDLIALARWMAEYYATPLGEVLPALLPAGIRAPRFQPTRFAPGPDRAALEAFGTRTRSERRRRIAREALERGVYEVPRAGLTAERGVLRDLVRRGLLVPLPDPAPSPPPEPSREPAHELTAEQADAVRWAAEALEARRFRALLLHGVTGSGKTEVYLRSILAARERGLRSLVLVPEIALTPQAVARFRARFPDVAVLHSGLPPATRAREWRRALGGEATVVIGTRSAVFAPVPDLGLLVVDEEHDGSFKQQSAPRYHGRDVAVKRAELLGLPVMLGSATPSMESLLNARRERYDLRVLSRRPEGRPLPHVEVVDLARDAIEQRHASLFTRRLDQLLRETLRAGGQAILFLNRRGYATRVSCPLCGHVLRCRRCELALTFHLSGRRALCHLCGLELVPGEECPSCRGPWLRLLGAGTQRVEEFLGQRFPGVRIARMDSDTMTHETRYRETLERFGRGEFQVLLGTQMVAKGHDFPGVTLVGVIAADTSLHLPDFRAAERTFQLLLQVAGRAGRGDRPGRVVIQTYAPDHYAVAAAARQDFDAFARDELEFRRQFRYPPFTRAFRITLEGRNEGRTRGAADAIARAVRELRRPDLDVLGPAPAVVYRAKGLYRLNLFAKGERVLAIREAARAARGVPVPSGVRLVLDIDPVGL
jgi:primosomal protein N' (replication factor Y)